MKRWLHEQRWKRLVMTLSVPLIVVAADGCAVDRSTSVVSRPAFAPRFPERAKRLFPRGESVEGVQTSNQNLEGGACSIGAVACGLLVTTLYPDALGEYWEHYGEVFFKDPSRQGQLGQAGEAYIKRGSIFAGSSGIQSMNCARTLSNGCNNYAIFDSSCQHELNFTLSAVAQTAHYGGRVYTGTNIEQGYCDGPPPPTADPCDGDDGGKDEDPEMSVVRADMIDPQDPTTVADIERGEIAYDCGGSGAEGPECWFEYWTIWISFDGGETWDVIWEGNIEVCAAT